MEGETVGCGDKSSLGLMLSLRLTMALAFSVVIALGTVPIRAFAEQGMMDEPVGIEVDEASQETDDNSVPESGAVSLSDDGNVPESGQLSDDTGDVDLIEMPDEMPLEEADSDDAKPVVSEKGEDALALEPQDETGTRQKDSDDESLKVGVQEASKGAAKGTTKPGISYRVHVQIDGDQDWRKDGKTAGTSGQSKRLESIRIKLSGSSVSGGVEYRTHVQGIGWQDWRADGRESGTHGQSKRLEAIQIKLTGQMAQKYDIYYRVHAQTYGWMGWAKNGSTSGTAGQSKRLEAIQIRLVSKGGSAPSTGGQQTQAAFRGTEGVSVQAHVQGIGWQDPVGNGKVAGTNGESKRIEALRISLVGTRVPGEIEANVQLQGIGWQGWRSREVGTCGESRRVEAICVRLIGEAAQTYDVQYRVHIQNGGWMAWTENGASAGTEGLSLRIEALQVRLVRKGAAYPNSSNQSISQAFVHDQNVSYRICRGSTWQAWRADGKTAGSAGRAKLVGVQARTEGDLSGGLSYTTHVSGVGWLEAASNGGTSGLGARRIEAFTMKLSGQAARLYNVWYRGYVHGQGWMDWAKNGQQAGSVGQSLALEAIQVKLVSKAQSAPGRTAMPLFDRLERMLRSLTLEQKVAQLFVVTPESLTGGGTVTYGSASLANAISSRPVGGIIYFAANLRNPSQTRALLASTRDSSVSSCGMVPLQCVDEEGGRVARISGNSAFGVANPGDMRDIGNTGSTSIAKSVAQRMGTYLKDLGFNVDLAPVADIAQSSYDVMYSRSFGGDPQFVSSMVSAQVEGFSSTGVLCTAKHFPGKGDSGGDSHYVRVFTDRTEEQMQSWNLLPFKAAIDKGVPLIMVGHLNCLSFPDGDVLPASLNPALIDGLLRRTLGYDGLVITDALGMGAVDDVCGDAQQGVLTIKAGADLVLMPRSFDAAYYGLLNAVRSGEISEARIDQSVRRVIRAKMTL